MSRSIIVFSFGSFLIVSAMFSAVFYYDQELYAPCEWCCCYGSYSTPESCKYYHDWTQLMNRLIFVPPILGVSGSIMVLFGWYKK